MTDYSLVLAPGTDAQQVAPVEGMLFVGRECAGIDPSRRIVIDDPAVSRVHFEVRVHPARGAILIDTSTNGTRLNGRRVERGEQIELKDGDRIEVGEVQLMFAAPDGVADIGHDAGSTIRSSRAELVVAVVGDIVGYTTLSETHGAAALGEAAHELFAALARLLTVHHGTASNYAGDAMFAVWDAARDPEAAGHAVRFALAASDLVAERAVSLPIRAPQGPIRMGWGVTVGEAATSRPSPAREIVHGDTINLAFRLAGLAAREGRAPVLVTESAAAVAPTAAAYGEMEEIAVRGRSAMARVRAAERRPA